MSNGTSLLPQYLLLPHQHDHGKYSGLLSQHLSMMICQHRPPVQPHFVSQIRQSKNCLMNSLGASLFSIGWVVLRVSPLSILHVPLPPLVPSLPPPSSLLFSSPYKFHSSLFTFHLFVCHVLKAERKRLVARVCNEDTCVSQPSPGTMWKHRASMWSEDVERSRAMMSHQLSWERAATLVGV